MNLLVIDTETAGLKTQTLIDIGYRVIDLAPDFTFKTVCTRSYLRRDIYANRLFMVNDSLAGEEKLARYDVLVNNGDIILRTLPQMLAMLANDIARYQPAAGYAYNCAFDIDKINRASLEANMPNPLNDLPIYDIWGYAYNYICSSPEYIAWAKGTGQTTKTGQYLSTSVEAVTRYLTGNPDFTEQHTACDDTRYEAMILAECAKRGADIFETAPRHGFLPSDKIFQERLLRPDTGELIEFKYTKCRTDKNGIKIYS